MRRRGLDREGDVGTNRLEPSPARERNGNAGIIKITKTVKKEQIKDIDSHLPVPKLSFKTAAVLIICVSLACYWHSCYGEFVFDDSEAIINNNDLRPETPVSKLFVHDFWGGNLTSNNSHKSYRPLTVLTFRLNYWLAGGLKPCSFHLVNVILNALVSAISLCVFSVIFGGTSNIGGKRFVAAKASFLCALLFALHPIHTESVSMDFFLILIICGGISNIHKVVHE